MSDYPIKEQITQAVVAKLKTITPANGYTFDLSDDGETKFVTRPRRTGERNTPQVRPLETGNPSLAVGISVLQSDEVSAPEHDVCGDPPLVGRTLPISCDLGVRLSEKSEQPMDQALNQFEADVVKCLFQDVRWGGLAIDTRQGPSLYADGSNGVEGVTVVIEIDYRVAQNDPYVNGA